MRTPIALLSLVLLGCNLNHSEIQPRPTSLVIVGGQKVDAPPHLLDCGVSPDQMLAGASAYLTVPVQFTVTPEGTVAPGSAQVSGRVRSHVRTTNESDAVDRLRAHEAAARESAQRNAETCTFTPAERQGQRVAVNVQKNFWYAE